MHESLRGRVATARLPAHGAPVLGRRLLLTEILALPRVRSVRWWSRTSANYSSVAEFGPYGDGRQDVTNELRAAARSVPDSGGTLLIHPGTYRIGGTIFLKSGTRVIGPDATLVASKDWQIDSDKSPPQSQGYSAIANQGFAASEIVDHDITVQGLSFDYSSLPRGNAHAIAFRKARRIQVLDCTFAGGGNATAMLACQTTSVARCMSHGTLNCAYDHWEGCRNATVTDCVAVCKNAYGILFTGVGTNPNDHHNATGFKAIKNRIYTPTEAGIWICSLSEHSSIDDVVLAGNYVYVGSIASGIGATGNVRKIIIQDNVVEAVQGGNAIFLRPDYWSRPYDGQIISNHVYDCVTEDRNIAVIQALGDRITARGNRAMAGNYPSLVWIDGKQCTLADNTGDRIQSRLKYHLDRAQAPVVSDP
jgi:hypothetical protein